MKEIDKEALPIDIDKFFSYIIKKEFL